MKRGLCKLKSIKSRLFRQTSMAILALCLCVGILTGCEKTPEESIVKEKGSGAAGGYASAGDDNGVLLKEELNIPEHYKNTSSYEEGGLIIDTDATVTVPEVSSMDTILVSAMKADQSMIDTVTKAFFGDSKIYNGITYAQLTKEQVQTQLNLLKRYKAEGNTDPYELGTDDNGQPYYDINAEIERYEKDLQTAPDEPKKEEVKPALGMEYPSDKTGKMEKLEGAFEGIAETEEGNYEYSIMTDVSGPNTAFRITKIRTDLSDRQEFADWLEGEYIMDTDSPYVLSEDEMKSLVDISYEDAKKIAEEKVNKLGMDFKVYNTDYALFYHGEGGFRKEKMLDSGYIFHFSRVINSAPITFTSEYGGGVEDMDSTLVPWEYERCDIIVGNDGIQKVELKCPYEIKEVQTKNVQLMDFDEIMKIYEQMMEVSNADITQYEKQRTYHIKKITLGYSRIYDPATKNDQGILVPVWDFIGAFDVVGEMVEESETGRKTTEFSEKHSGEHSNQSFMTINAIDGTIIDRSLGY